MLFECDVFSVINVKHRKTLHSQRTLTLPFSHSKKIIVCQNWGQILRPFFKPIPTETEVSFSLSENCHIQVIGVASSHRHTNSYWHQTAPSMIIFKYGLNIPSILTQNGAWITVKKKRKRERDWALLFYEVKQKVGEIIKTKKQQKQKMYLLCLRSNSTYEWSARVSWNTFFQSVLRYKNLYDVQLCIVATGT